MSGKLILTIDDNPDFNRILAATLKRNQFKVITTTTAEEFFEKLKTNPPDLCLIDLNLKTSKGEGFQLIKAIRNKRGFEIPLLVLSRRSSKEDISHALQVGATDYVQKPIDEDSLLSKISYALNLYKDESSRFSFKKVSETLGQCKITSDFKISSINELGITIVSKSLISKGAQLVLSGSFLDEVTGRSDFHPKLYVSKNWLENGLYHMYLDFDSSDTELMNNVRRWVVEHQENV